MRGQFKDGTWRMKSEVQFYSGHANNECIAFNYRNKGGDYKTGVYWGGRIIIANMDINMLVLSLTI